MQESLKPIAEMIGIEKETPWEGLFSKGIHEIDSAKFPAMPEIRNNLN